MQAVTEINITKSPTFLNIAFAALQGKSDRYDPQKPLPGIILTRKVIPPDIQRLDRFTRICGLEEAQRLPLVYPLTFIYPMVQILLARREIPFPLTHVLNTRMKIIQHRHIEVTDNIRVDCTPADHRVVEKGAELDIFCTLQINNVIVWECTITFYCRGHFGTPVEGFIPPSLEPIPNAPEFARWHLPSGSGISFARLSGDWNPIHYWTWYARLLGFKRAFAQPLLVLAETLCRLESRHPADHYRLEIAFKGPVYYQSNVILKNVEQRNSERFDIYCEDNPKPCISGRLEFKK